MIMAMSWSVIEVTFDHLQNTKMQFIINNSYGQFEITKIDLVLVPLAERFFYFLYI